VLWRSKPLTFIESLAKKINWMFEKQCVKMPNITNRKKEMNATVLTPNPNRLTQLTYQVIIEKHDEDLYSAIVWELPECRSSGASKEEALKVLHRLLIERLKRVEIVSLIIWNFCCKKSALARKIYGLPRSYFQRVVFYLPGIA